MVLRFAVVRSASIVDANCFWKGSARVRESFSHRRLLKDKLFAKLYWIAKAYFLTTFRVHVFRAPFVLI